MNWLQRLLGRDDINFGERVYMRRWLFPPRWLKSKFWRRLPGLRIHNIRESDGDRELHDHPFDFVSVVLKGGYWEHTADGKQKFYGPGSILFRKAETLHRLELPMKWSLCDSPHCPYEGRHEAVTHECQDAWTFVLRGPIRRPWGFMTATGWVHWEQFQGAGSTS
jgi:hypothetical protein